MSAGHTIILLQTSGSVQSRTYLDFDTKGKAMDAVVRMFEDRLKELTPMSSSITYDVQDLFRYLDNIQDISALVLDGSGKFVPLDKEAIKTSIFENLKRSAGGK